MHIARVVHVFFPEAIGDPYNSYELSLRQAARGHRVTVITWARQTTANWERVTEGFEVCRSKGINFKLDGVISDYPFLPNLASVLRNIKPNIIHAHSHLFLSSFEAIKEAKKLRLPSVLTVGGVSVERDAFTNFAQQSYLYTVGRWIFRNATRIICLTRSDAYEAMKYGAERLKISIVPNAIDLNLFKPSNEKSIEPLFVWVGRVVPEKGLHYLVKAIKVVVRDYKDAKFILIGDGPMLPLIKKMVEKLGLNEYVRFAGFMDSKSVSHILSKATGFVFPSLKEGMPKAVLEAMACGIPIIASGISGIDEFVTNGYDGLLVPPEDHQMLGEAIMNVINDSSLAAKLGANARKTVETGHNWDAILGALDSVYKEALRHNL
jgi:glycosyltransferase involved in cell wall biosynthesis